MIVARLRKRDWYRIGGFRNSACFRRQKKNGGWNYYVDITRTP